ncbi:assimilatory sulfite reductase (NADPH) flavoprotein subunit [Paraglaciecola sp. 25GB23A]|uniref:assimilatory sulfite reductase (NADPH) flavoprotein subunit n=1 Tax=Paraglaciecola sp. 25GB23A TaxID=3156068 RepID=UPI0032AEB909
MSSETNNRSNVAVGLNDPQWLAINQVTAALNPSQLNWLSGYFAGLAQSSQGQVLPVQQTAVAKSLTILFGSQTGNAKLVATELKAKLEANNISTTLVSMADYKAKQLKSESHVVAIVSTHGEGDAPDDAVELHAFLASKKAPKLPDLHFAVLGLGDSSYEFFCQTGKDFDQRLADLGAKRILDRLDCDVDYEASVNAWSDALMAKIADEMVQAEAGHTQLTSTASESTLNVVEYNKKFPFKASLLTSQKITGRDSVKDIRHIEVSLEDSGIQYQAGDALGVWFNNDEQLVSDLLELLAIDKNESIKLAEQSLTIFEALVEKLELTLSYPTFAKAYNEYAASDELAAKLEDKAVLRVYLAERQIIDVVRDYPAKLSAQQLVDALRPMAPRLYSIASSQAEVEDEVHLTVAVVEYDAHGYRHQGGASGFLAKRLEEGGEVRVFVEKNDNFRLPENPDTPVIMIGPGTGIAPFRAFMQQREADEAQGKNWLFFGNPNYTQDFLYQVEWQRFVKDGVVDKVSLAFSRDQEEKVYVQHRLLEQGAEVYQWLQDGAHIYVCGDADHMAKDVNDALMSIVQLHGDKDSEQAEQYIMELRRAKRYQKDVY